MSKRDLLLVHINLGKYIKAENLGFTKAFGFVFDVPETTRTSDPSLRRRMLYPLSYGDIYFILCAANA